MKILAICQYYYPEPFRINDICEELVKRGHKVTILTDVPNYPVGKVYQGYEKKQKREEDINGVHVIRCATIPRKPGTIYRLLNYLSYPISSWLKVGKLPGDFDVIFVNQQSPVMMAWPGIRYAKKHHKKIVMYCMDLWPASLVAGGILPSSLIYRLFYRISKHVYQKADRILVTSRMFKPYLHEEFGIAEAKLDYLPQYAEGIFDYMEPRKPDGLFNLLFAGNIGTAQSLDTIIDAAERVKFSPVHFYIVGGGVELERLKKCVEEKHLTSVTFLGQKPLEEMPQLYKTADAMLVTLQKDPVLSLTLPGKVQSYMASGRPIIGAADGETNAAINEAQCGFCGPADDGEELAKNIIRFIGAEDKAGMGLNGRKYYEEHFDKNRFMDKLEREIQ